MYTPVHKPTVRSGNACTFVPRSYHVLVVEHDSPERITELTTQSFRAHYLNVNTGEVEHSKTFGLRAPIHLHFIQCRHFPKYAYIGHYAGKLERFACSCMEGKQGHCCHIEELTNLHAPEVLEVEA